VWDFQVDGYAFTIPPSELQREILVKDVQGTTQKIPQLASDESQKLLGVMKNLMGNQQDEIARLRNKSNIMASKINTGALSATQAKMAYESFYIPALQYSLAITSINQIDFESIQSNASLAILAALGFNRHIPREVVYCTRKYQGLGLQHLYDMQGIDGTRLILQELNHNGPTKTMLQCVLDVIQMESGIGNPILEDNRPLSYIEWGWIPSIRDFLLHIKGKILNATTRPQLYREHDSYLMDSPALHKSSRKEQILINRCRLFLQVERVSDISNANGTSILDDWKQDSELTPSRSTKSWPLQGNPGREAWKIWRSFLEKAFETNGKLQQNLGDWTQFNTERIHFVRYQESSHTLWYYLSDNKWTIHRLIRKDRRSMTFEDTHEKSLPMPPEDSTPIDVLSHTEYKIITSRYSRMTPPIPLEKSTQKLSLQQQLKLREGEPLFHNIQITVPDDDIHQQLQQPATFDVATDGSYNKSNGVSSYGWVMALTEQSSQSPEVQQLCTHQWQNHSETRRYTASHPLSPSYKC
jgi:hypothetical protein